MTFFLYQKNEELIPLFQKLYSQQEISHSYKERNFI